MAEIASALIGKPLRQVFLILGLFFTVYWQIASCETSPSPSTWLPAILPPCLTAVYAIAKRSLDFPAALLALLVGIVLAKANVCFYSSLLAFFVTGSELTKWKKEEKQKFEPLEESDGRRNWIQVFCNGGVSSIAALLYMYVEGMKATPCLAVLGTNCWSWSVALELSCLGSISCCCGDTWASEVGSVVNRSPLLVTTLRRVPRGTNGGVSLPGLLASALGGLLIGTIYCLTYLSLHWQGVVVNIVPVPQLSLPLLGLMAGLIGSLIDSLLGATLQYSGYNPKTGRMQYHPSDNCKHISGRNVLSNDSVNLLSSAVMAVLTPVMALAIFAF